MNKTIKKVIVIFTILCALLLIVFSIELILLNRNAENGDARNGNAEPSLSGTPPPGNSSGNGNPGSPETGSSGSAAGTEGTASAGGTAPPTPAGARHERLMPDDANLVFYVDDELFEHTETELEDILDIFSFRGEGTAGLEISFVFMPIGVSAYADSFLEMNYNVGGTTVYGAESIKRSTLRGVFATGMRNETTYEAWIYTFSDPEFDNMGISFVIHFQNETQRSALYSILDSLEMASG